MPLDNVNPYKNVVPYFNALWLKGAANGVQFYDPRYASF